MIFGRQTDSCDLAPPIPTVILDAAALLGVAKIPSLLNLRSFLNAFSVHAV